MNWSEIWFRIKSFRLNISFQISDIPHVKSGGANTKRKAAVVGLTTCHAAKFSVMYYSSHSCLLQLLAASTNCKTLFSPYSSSEGSRSACAAPHINIKEYSAIVLVKDLVLLTRYRNRFLVTRDSEIVMDIDTGTVQHRAVARARSHKPGQIQVSYHL